MKNRLLLLRHARAQWASPGERDRDRALAPEGVEEAHAMAAAMPARGHLPDFVLCSAARRCRETWEEMSGAFGDVPVEFTDSLYQAGPTGYLNLIRERGRGLSLLIIGHNPVIEALALALAGGSERDAERLAGGFPTCALAVIELDGTLADIAPGRSRLLDFVTPRSLTRR
jgi:phosphohistidine phosphatase